MIKKLTKGIEEAKNEKEKLTQEKEKMKSTFKEIEQNAFTVQENYKKTQEVSGPRFWTDNSIAVFVNMNDFHKQHCSSS